MQRIKWIDQRLEGWALWRLASDGYTSPSFEYIEGSTIRHNFIEISAAMEADAMMIDQAIAALPNDLSTVVVAFYTWGGGVSQITEKLAVTRATVHRRLCHADIRIASWLDAQKLLRESRHRERIV
ncbi:hypothetical protein [Paralcaligenes ginsengisoli]